MEARAVQVGLGHVAIGLGGVDVRHVVGRQRGDGVGVGGRRGGGGFEGRRRLLPRGQAMEEEEMIMVSAALMASVRRHSPLHCASRSFHGTKSIGRAWNLETMHACW